MSKGHGTKIYIGDTMASKTKALKFRTKAEAMMQTLSAAYDPAEPYPWSIWTRYGTYRMSIHPNWVAGRFDDPNAAIAGGIDCNPYSGKWNWHPSDPDSFDFDYILHRLRKIQ